MPGKHDAVCSPQLSSCDDGVTISFDGQVAQRPQRRLHRIRKFSFVPALGVDVDQVGCQIGYVLPQVQSAHIGTVTA